MPTNTKKPDPAGALQLDATPEEKTEKAAVATRALPEQVTRRGITDAQWRTLCNSLFPGANPNSVLMVWDYCVARKLDPLKKPCHIVPMEVTIRTATGERREWRDVVLPGIYEHRTTAQRTGLYLGHTKAEYGPLVKQHGVEAPEWCAMEMFRWNEAARMKVAYPVQVYFREAVALKAGGQANARWARAPIQMLTKCTEAAGLREAFPDEIGGEMTAEEMEGQRHIDLDATTLAAEALPKPARFDDWLVDLTAVAESGWEAFEKAWHESAPELRDYLAKTDADLHETLKARASATAATTTESAP